MTTKHAGHIVKDIQEVTTRLKAGYALMENDQAILKKTLDDMHILLAAQLQVEKCLVYALVELFEAIDRSTKVLQDQQQIDALYMLVDDVLLDQLLDMLPPSKLPTITARHQLKESFITEVVDFATRIRMGYAIDQQRYELMLLSLEQLIALHHHTSSINKDLACCCIDCFVAFCIAPDVYPEQERQARQQRIHTLQNKIKVFLTD